MNGFIRVLSILQMIIASLSFVDFQCASDRLTSISGYVSGINWDGTPFSYEARTRKTRS